MPLASWYSDAKSGRPALVPTPASSEGASCSTTHPYEVIGVVDSRGDMSFDLWLPMNLAAEAIKVGSHSNYVLEHRPDEMVGDVRGPLGIAFGATAFVVLIACANRRTPAAHAGRGSPERARHGQSTELRVSLN